MFKILLFKLMLALGLVLCFNFSARAHSSDSILVPNSTPWSFVSGLTTPEIEERTLAVLNYYKVIPSQLPEEFLNKINNPRTLAEMQKILKLMDPTGVFQSLSKVSGNELIVFKDRKVKSNLDFTFELSNSSLSSQKPSDFHGLKIALDPGHMGGEFWDKVTGKFVKDPKGIVISEGVLNLQICLLLKDQLEKLGATVLLTRTGLTPVSKLDYKTFDLKPFARYEILESVHADWFQKLIAKAPVGPKLFALFDQSPEIKKLFSERSRSDFFSKRADLWARADMINKFNADIVLIIHHDTVSSTDGASSGLNPNAPNETKSFVFGSYENAEFGSTASRAYFVRHLVDKESWDNSVLMSRKITTRLYNKLGLKLDTSSNIGGRLVEPGIRARNLMLPRILLAQNIAYMENLFYNRPAEFNALIEPDYKMIIDGKNFTYSKRHVQIVEALRLGLEDFLK